MERGLKKGFLFLAFGFVIAQLFAGSANAATLYVDGSLGSDCTSGDYSVSSRNCGGSDGNAYATLHGAAGSASAGDTILIRSGTYDECELVLDFDSGTTTFEGYQSEFPEIHCRYYKTTLLTTQSSGNLAFNKIKFTGAYYFSDLASGSWVKTSGQAYTYEYSVSTATLGLDSDTISTGGIHEVRSGTRYQMTERASVAEVESNANSWYIDDSARKIYLHPSGNSDPNTNGYEYVPDADYDEMAFWDRAASSSSLITIDNCEFTNFVMCGMKTGRRTWVKNSYFHDIGEDGNDHGIYGAVTYSLGGESIIEHNLFVNIPGAGVHLYGSNPEYYIVRYNIFNNGHWGVLLGAGNSKVYGNVIYDEDFGIMMFGGKCHDNEVKNNIFDGNSYDVSIDCGAGGAFTIPDGNVMTYNYYGSSNVCSGCGGGCGVGSTWDDEPPNIRDSANPFMQSSPSGWQDFRLASSSLAIDSGANLGAGNDMALDPSDASWPPSTLDQDSYGSGWEIGAFVYGSAPVYECSDTVDNDGDGATDLADSGCADASDNDESDCDDGVCEPAAGETCSSCVSDCGACSSSDVCDSLIALYHLDGDAQDSQGSNDGAVNGATQTTGKYGQAYSFDGDNDYLNIPHDSLLNPSGDFSVNVWVKTTDSGTLTSIVNKHDALGAENGYAISMRPDGTIKIRTGDDIHSRGEWDSSTAINDGNWNHVLAVFDKGNSNPYLYINGELDSLSGTSNLDRETGPITTTQPLQIGYNSYNPPYVGTYFNGSIDDVAIWSRALSDSEISDIYASGAPITCGTASSCPSGADTSGNDAVDITELMSHIAAYNVGGVTMNSLMAAIDEWMYGC